jgi:rare lipoprotein A
MMTSIRALTALCALLLLAGCTEIQFMSSLTKGARSASNGPSVQQGTFKVGKPYQVEGQWYYPQEQYDLVETGLASWYGPGFDGQRTASGEVYHSDELTAAHRTLQMPSLVRVTNLDNGRSIIVRVNDRGPYKRGRVMDVSSKAADLLGMKGAGTAKVKLQVLSTESMRVAQLAKTGANTRGYEVAMNGQGEAPQTYQTASVGAVSRTPLPPAGPVPGHIEHGAFYPDPIVTRFPVTPTGIYVQAGSFTRLENAQRLSLKLQTYRTTTVIPALVNGRQFYRVRLGPVASVDAADQLLARMIQGGHNKAIIVVE